MQNHSAPSQGPTPWDLGTAAYTAGAKLGADIISNSYGEDEKVNATRYYNVPGHVYVAASLDNGGGTKLGGGPVTPCMYATVVCVGGTQLERDGSARGWKEGVYNDFIADKCGDLCGATGSGCSRIIAKPSFQTDKGCTMRSGTDVSADASILTPLAMYTVIAKTAQNPSGWSAAGGTSLATPIIAGIFALAGNAATRHGARELWESATGFYDVTSGTNVLPSVTGRCASTVKYICVARPGYDGPTGLGTPNGMTAF